MRPACGEAVLQPLKAPSVPSAPANHTPRAAESGTAVLSYGQPCIQRLVGVAVAVVCVRTAGLLVAILGGLFLFPCGYPMPVDTTPGKCSVPLRRAPPVDS